MESPHRYLGAFRSLADEGTRGPSDDPAKPAAALPPGGAMGGPDVRAGSRPRRPVIYLDSSVALARLLAEDRRPPPELWSEELISSRLLDYELWTRLHARELAATHGDLARLLLARIARLALSKAVLERALDPFPMPVRTVDALHLASIVFLRERGHEVALATYDARQADAACAMGIARSDLMETAEPVQQYAQL